ncbi:MAG: ABC transporter ATP-binding protein [Deltaproteobacteria bacterium]|nr:ABC transporter ATP-binding protein [Deltaproteobacteria bacterium]
MEPPLLEVKDLTVQFHLRRGTLRAVENLSFFVREGETLGIVGETGCGKSVTALSILRLLPSPPCEVVKGEIIFETEDLLKKGEAEMQKIRGRKISMIFQEPMTSLNPSLTIGEQIAECFRVHLGCSKREARARTEQILNTVHIPSPKALMDRYPHEFSGGMRQRVMIAIALACEPKLLVADEPTTALDVTIQGQILDLLDELRGKMNIALVFISHNLGVVAQLCNRIGVMYAGSFVEMGDKESLFTRPLHPYTTGLLKAIPLPHRRNEPLAAIRGSVCDLMNPPRGCKFHPRCHKAAEICRVTPPVLEPNSSVVQAACHFAGE